MVNGQEKSDSRATGGGVGGAKVGDQEECGTAAHAADAEPGAHVPIVGPRKAARLRKRIRFTALFHHINVDTLRTAFYALKRKAAPGVDGMTWQDYEADLGPRLKGLGSTGSVSPATVSPDVYTEVPPCLMGMEACAGAHHTT